MLIRMSGTRMMRHSAEKSIEREMALCIMLLSRAEASGAGQETSRVDAVPRVQKSGHRGLHSGVETGHPTLHQTWKASEHHDNQRDQNEHAHRERASLHRGMVGRRHHKDAL